jgi:hypothetical protein
MNTDYISEIKNIENKLNTCKELKDNELNKLEEFYNSMVNYFSINNSILAYYFIQKRESVNLIIFNRSL